MTTSTKCTSHRRGSSRRAVCYRRPSGVARNRNEPVDSTFNSPIWAENCMSGSFTDEELMAYADERLPVDRASELERLLRGSSVLVQRLAELVQSRESVDPSLGSMWRRGRWSCPPRAVWSAFVDGRLGDGLSQHLRFHVETIGCRVCAANLADIQQSGDRSGSTDRIRKIFQSSAGRLSVPPSPTDVL